MRIPFHPFVIILFLLTMLLVSACRAARSAAIEEQATHAASATQSSVTYDSSLASLFRALSLRADSIVLWMQPGIVDGRATTVAEEEKQSGYDQYICTDDKGSTAQLSAAQRMCRAPKVGKVVIAGIQLQSVANKQKQTSSHARDSLSARESHQSSLSESVEEEPPNAHARVYIMIFILLAAIIAAAALYIKKKFL